MHIYKQVCFINKYHYNSKLPIVGYIWVQQFFCKNIYVWIWDEKNKRREKRIDLMMGQY